jgi:hypothetical protein
MLLEHQELKTFQAGQKVEWLLPVGVFFVRCKWETSRSSRSSRCLTFRDTPSIT